MINTVTQSAVYFCNAFKSRLNVLFTVHVTNNHQKMHMWKQENNVYECVVCINGWDLHKSDVHKCDGCGEWWCIRVLGWCDIIYQKQSKVIICVIICFILHPKQKSWTCVIVLFQDVNNSSSLAYVGSSKIDFFLLPLHTTSNAFLCQKQYKMSYFITTIHS